MCYLWLLSSTMAELSSWKFSPIKLKIVTTWPSNTVPLKYKYTIYINLKWLFCHLVLALYMNYLASYQTNLVYHFILMIMLIYDLNKMSNQFYLVLILHGLPIKMELTTFTSSSHIISMSPRGGLGSDKYTYMYMFCEFLLVCICVCVPLCLCICGFPI